MNQSKKPLVCIIVINWNGIEESVDCLRSMLKLDYSNYKIILYDNASEKNEALELKKIFKKNKKIDFIRSEKNWGFDEGCNRGILYAKKKYNSPYYLISNNDVVVKKDFLTELVKVLEKNPSYGGASPKIYNKENKIWWRGKVKYNPWTGRLKDDKYTNKICETDFITGCSMLIKKEVVEKAGFLRPKFFLSGLDTLEYSLRIKRKGFKLFYVPSSVIWHLCGISAWRMHPLKRIKYELIGVIEFFKIAKWYHLPTLILSHFIGFIQLRLRSFYIFITNKGKRKKFLQTFKKFHPS